jgi:hypothetical protein
MMKRQRQTGATGSACAEPERPKKRLRLISGFNRMKHVNFNALIPSLEAEIQTLMRQQRFSPPFPEPQKRTWKIGQVLSDQRDFWNTVVSACVVAERHGMMPLTLNVLHKLFQHFYPECNGHSKWLRPKWRRGGDHWTLIEVWHAAGVRLTGRNLQSELVQVHLIPWWLRHGTMVHRMLEAWIPTAPSDLSGDAMMDAALDAIRQRHDWWPNHGEIDRKCLAAVADPDRLARNIQLSQDSGVHRIDWSEDLEAIASSVAFSLGQSFVIDPAEGSSDEGGSGSGRGEGAEGGWSGKDQGMHAEGSASGPGAGPHISGRPGKAS